MFNEFRTLLLNRSGTDIEHPDFPGELMVPQEFRRRVLPEPANQVWETIFGSEPDRLGLNYRLAEVVALTESSDLAGGAVVHDSRLTYDPAEAVSRWRFGPQWSVAAELIRVVTAPGAFAPGAGICARIYRAEVTGDTATTRLYRPERTKSTAVTFAGGWSTAFGFPETTLLIRVAEELIAVPFRLDLTVRPPALGDLTARIIATANSVLPEFFAVSAAPHAVTWRNRFLTDAITSNRLAAVFLTLAEHVRNSPVDPEG